MSSAPKWPHLPNKQLAPCLPSKLTKAGILKYKHGYGYEAREGRWRVVIVHPEVEHLGPSAALPCWKTAQAKYRLSAVTVACRRKNASMEPMHSLESAARNEAILIYNNSVRSGPRAAVEHASEVVLAWAKSPVRIVEGMKSSAPQQHE